MFFRCTSTRASPYNACSLGVHLHVHHLCVRDAGDLRAGQVLAQPVGGAPQLYQGPGGVHQPGQFSHSSQLL